MDRDLTHHESAALLARAGAALHGEHWQSPLARDLDVHLRTMQRWAAGRNAVRPSVWGDLLTLLAARGEEVREIIALLRPAP